MTQRIRQAILQRDYGRLDDAGLEPEVITRYLAVLARLAAADGISMGEHLLVERIATFLGVAEDQLARAFLLAEDRGVSMEALVQAVSPDRALALCLLRDAYRVAAADRELTPAELVVITEIADVLGFEPVVVGEVKAIVYEEQRAQRGFASLMQRGATGVLDRLKR
ncbi:MAG: TerB family tellurite resistance protein [Anaeromyxobacter sp.]